MGFGIASRSALEARDRWAGGTGEDWLTNAEQLEAAILALEAQRGKLDDSLVEVALAPLRAQLATMRAAEQQAAPTRLRLITVLFTDIVESTALGARLDAEDVLEIVTRALTRFGAIVEAHRGRVTRYTGDGLKGIFGADADTEDAPESAVRAGLAIIAAARDYAATLRAERNITSFQVRVGINTGLVALGGGVEADNTAVGTAVNLAARLEQAAPVGSVLISKDTFTHVRGLFDVIEQPPLQVKGHGAALDTYVVQRARARAFGAVGRGVAGVETHMVGRDDELAQLQAAYDKVVHERALRAVTVFGEAGVGKSRLLAELQQALRKRTPGDEPLLARARPQLRLQPYGLLREMLAGAMQIADTDSADMARKRWSEEFGSCIDPIEAEMLGHLVGLDYSATPDVARIRTDARQLRDRAFRASLQWLRDRAHASTTPLVLLLDDLHWADHGTLSWLRHLLQNMREEALYVVMLARPTLLEVESAWTADDERHQRIDLAALEGDASTALARGLLHRLVEIPPALIDVVTRGGGGNPFFMEELVNMLIDDGVIRRGDDPDGPWHVLTERFGGIRVPPTITGVLQARIDALAPPARAALQQASIIGPVFWDAALDALQADSSASIPALAQRQMAVRRDASAFADCVEFAFSHHLLHQATYETVLKSARRIGHARAAAWLSERVQDRSLEHLSATADHYERAGDQAQAAHYFARAAQAAADRYANEAALEHAHCALANLAPANVEARFTMLNLLERVHDVMGNRAAQGRALDEMSALFPPGTAPQHEAGIALRRALLADRCGDFSTAAKHARTAAALAEQQGLWPIAARACGEQAYVLTREGDFERARELGARGLAHARRGDDRLAEAQMLAIWAAVEQAAHRLPEALAAGEQSIALAMAHGHLRLAGLQHGNIGAALLEIGDFEQSAKHQEASLRMSREIGNRMGEANALGGLAGVYLAQGRWDAALTAAREAVRIADSVGDRYAVTRWSLRLGRALSKLGRTDEAIDVYRRTDALVRSTGAVACGLDPAVRLASIELERGDVAAARLLLEPVLAADATAIEAADNALELEYVVFRVLQATGETRAETWLSAALRRLQDYAEKLPAGPVRDRFLYEIALHKEVLAARLQPSPPR
jgi:class 3 adenylate cyclase/tetratricopeptide (TPR) repeat protein